MIDGKGTYVVCSVEKLCQLVGTKCHESECGSPINIDYDVSGCCLVMFGCCANGHRLDWASSDFHTNKNGSKIYNINVALSAAIIFSGNSFSKISNCLKFMNVATISSSTFHCYQRHFIAPAVNKFYLKKQVYSIHSVLIFMHVIFM